MITPLPTETTKLRPVIPKLNIDHTGVNSPDEIKINNENNNNNNIINNESSGEETDSNIVIINKDNINEMELTDVYYNIDLVSHDIAREYFIKCDLEKTETKYILNAKSYDNTDNLDITTITNLFKTYSIPSLSSKNYFNVEKLWYRQRDNVFNGKIRDNLIIEEDMINAYIKIFSIQNQLFVYDITIELTIYFSLLNKRSTEKYISKMIAFYYDQESKFLYTFYQYYPTTWTEEVKSYDNYIETEDEAENTESVNTSMGKKIRIASQLIEFQKQLLLYGIIHLNMNLSVFLYDKASMNIKTFDFSNAFMLPISWEHQFDNTYYDWYFNKLISTPKYISPEFNTEFPLLGPWMDIWALGCCMIEIFIDKNKYKEDSLSELLMRIFFGKQFAGGVVDKKNKKITLEEMIPSLSKSIDLGIAKIIFSLLVKEIKKRDSIVELIGKFSAFCKKEKKYNWDITIDLSKTEENAINEYIQFYIKLKDKFLYYVLIKYNIRFSDIHTFTKGKEECDLFDETLILQENQLAIQKVTVNKKMKYIDEFRAKINTDYEMEKKRIQESYEGIRKKWEQLKKMQLNNLDKSREFFWDSKFRKIFNESRKIGELCNNFYFTKKQYLSHLNRFNTAWYIREVNAKNFYLFKKKFTRFNDITEQFIKNSNKLKERCEDLRIPGKYIFRKELYTEEAISLFNGMQTKIIKEQHKYFDSSKNSKLFWSNELFMIIPLTNSIFSYSTNAYKKWKIDFETHKVKIKSFLPGCATLHQGDYFFITGGEVKDEATSSFTYMKIMDKIIEEGVEMNFTRRFHTMMSLFTEKSKSFICVIGGWDSKEVEIIETTGESFTKWNILPSMHYSRSDPTTFWFNKKYIYVFGGWDYSLKRCVREIERYEVFNNETVKWTKQWETIKVKGDGSWLQKYNMGLINLPEEKKDNMEKILIVGGYNEAYDYSRDIVEVEILMKENYVNIKNGTLLSDGNEASFWYEKEFHKVKNDLTGEFVAANFNCFNNLCFYKYENKMFDQIPNSTTKM